MSTYEAYQVAVRRMHDAEERSAKAEARAERAERQRDEARFQCDLLDKASRRLDEQVTAEKARVAELEAGINALADKWDWTYVGFVRRVHVPALRALTEKGSGK